MDVKEMTTADLWAHQKKMHRALHSLRAEYIAIKRRIKDFEEQEEQMLNEIDRRGFENEKL